MTYHFRRGGNIWKEWNLSFECPDAEEVPVLQNSQNAESPEPDIFWDQSQSPRTKRTIPPSPLALKMENKHLNAVTQSEEGGSQSSILAPSQPSPMTNMNTPTSHRLKGSSRRQHSVFNRKRKHVESENEKEDLLKKIHESAMQHLQSNVEAYIKKRDEEKSKKLSQRHPGDESDGESLFSPKTALERDLARFTPSKRKKFFPEARLYGSSQISTPCRSQLVSKRQNSTPKRPQSPMTSTPHHRENRSIVCDLNISPVTNGPPRRSKRFHSRIQQNDTECKPSSPAIDLEEKALPKKANLPKEVVTQQQPEVYIIADDSWDDSF